ncbi:MAG: hypothetical protein PHO09_13595, partial [Sphaerochaeta sp.]|nr:hypothetical protein [Sphaerochaeta sp.]
HTMKSIVDSAARLGQAGVENILVAGADFGEAAAKEALQYYQAHGSKKGNEYLKSQEFTNTYRK